MKHERLEKVLVSAMKQSLKAYLPKLNPIQSFEEFLRNTQNSGRYIAHCYEMDKPHLKDMALKDNSVLVMIGPEGDFSKDEVSVAQLHGFTSVTLGNPRLRTETAGIAACHIVNLAND